VLFRSPVICPSGNLAVAAESVRLRFHWILSMN